MAGNMRILLGNHRSGSWLSPIIALLTMLALGVFLMIALVVGFALAIVIKLVGWVRSALGGEPIPSGQGSKGRRMSRPRRGDPWRKMNRPPGPSTSQNSAGPSRTISLEKDDSGTWRNQ